ncbi:hypothetical protein [Streptococcus sp. sy018]|uniref:hypothetical protein n=1 Tax=Streptococcus sp. sy018 TaxID=2600147 RepID=UPI0011B6BD68|nr:hypothetical protein [Streptococcus sp. sy018]TWS95542.1 hypothetical protein FRX52_01720 [Streptococcus sp. sy018]
MTLQTKLKTIEKQMIDLALDFANHQVDGIYIYAVLERTVQSFDAFYRIQNNYVERHFLNDFLSSDYQIDKSSDYQFEFLEDGLDLIFKIIDLHQSSDSPYLTELWVIYDHTSNQWQTTYSYEARYEKAPLHVQITPYEEFYKWFDQVKSQGL